MRARAPTSVVGLLTIYATFDCLRRSSSASGYIPVMIFFLGLCAAGIVSLLFLLVVDARGDGALGRAGRRKKREETESAEDKEGNM